MFDVVIVEDDSMVAMLNRSFTQRDQRFQVVKEFLSGREALAWLTCHHVDLVILDVYMPLLTGTELLRSLRAHGSAVDVIMVTAAHETQTLDELLKLGVVDYLVKPFTAARFQQALDGFCQHRAALDGRERVTQSDIDRLLYAAPAETPAPKGLQEKTLERVRGQLRDAGGEQSCESIATGAGLSVVTARRYLNYMLEQGEAVSRINYDTGGRPSMAYRWAGD